MQLGEIIKALNALLKPVNEEVEDVHYNAGVIDAIKAINNLFNKSTPQISNKNPEHI